MAERMIEPVSYTHLDVYKRQVFALAQLAIAILGGILGWIPVMGWVLGLLFSFISWALGILYLVVSILCMVRAYQGQSVQLPFITNFVSGWNNL